MVLSTKKATDHYLPQLVATAIERGVLSRKDHLLLASAMLSSQTLTPQDRTHINQLFDLIRMGRVDLVD